MKQIIALAGSNSSNSINYSLLKHIKAITGNEGIQLLNISKINIPIYSIDEEELNGFPQEILQLNETFKQADGFILAVPEHNGSIPAFFKNILDWLSRVDRSIFYQKPTILLSTSPGGRGGASVLTHLSSILPYMGADLKTTYGIGNYFDKLKDNQFVDEGDNAQFLQIIRKAFNVEEMA